MAMVAVPMPADQSRWRRCQAAICCSISASHAARGQVAAEDLAEAAILGETRKALLDLTLRRGESPTGSQATHGPTAHVDA